MESEHQKVIQECIRKINFLNILKWNSEQTKQIIKAKFALEKILEI